MLSLVGSVDLVLVSMFVLFYRILNRIEVLRLMRSHDAPQIRSADT